MVRGRACGLALALLVGLVTVPAMAKPPCQSAGPAGVSTSCDGVGPGTFVAVDGGGGCTLNFVFADRKGAKYVGTAGHCAVAMGSGPHTWAPGRGPVVRTSTADGVGAGQAPGPVIGRVVYAVQEKDAVDDVDFAVIRLDRGVATYTSVPYFGGPSGINTAQTSSAEVLRLFGRPPGLGDTLPARYIAVRDLADPVHVFGTGVSAPGDSGGPVLDSNGKAIGLLLGVGGNQISAGTTGPPGDSHGGGVVRIIRLTPMLASAGRALHAQLRLVPGS